MASETAPQIPTAKGIMTFHPTMDEFQDFTRYIAYMESQGAHKAGLAKIIPPKEWKPRSNYDDIDELVIPAPIQQVVSGQSGLFIQYNIQKKAMTVSEFRKLANSEKFCCPRHENFEELERKYWKNVTFNPPIYGADVNGTLYDPKVKDWNVGKLHTILDTVEHESGITIEGVNTPYLYFGMWKTTFAWHTEDMDLYSINYLHFGEPKSWYCVPPEHGKRMERLAHGFFPSSAQNCEAFLRHKMTLISPSILRKYGIPFERMTQHAGEFMVTFPYSYHAGFNHGFNCAESTNFATERWIEYGKLATLCSCRKDMVKISMDVFVKKYQPERYEQWLAGRDMGHIDHSRPTSEAKEFLGEEPGDTSSSSQEICVDDCSTDGERKSPTQRIGTKRHRVCLEVPEEVVPKEEEEEEEEFIKRPRLSLLPPRAATEESRKLKGPPKLVVTPTKLTLMELPCLRMSSSSIPPASFRAQAQPLPRNGHLKVGSLPTRPGVGATSAQPARKLGVASLLFHKTLSPKETLQVHGNAHSQQQEQQQQQHHLQLHVHSYAREHQPRQLQHMGRPQDQARAPSQAGTETQDVKIIFTKVEKNQAKAASGEEVEGQSGKNDPRPAGKAQAPLERSAVKVVPVQAATHAKGVKKEVPQVNKRKGSGEQSYCKTVKDKQRAQLHNLPRQHPLLRADNTSSDEDTEVEVGEEYIPEDSNSWAKPLAQLWQNRPFNPQAEADYNRRMGLQAPYCSICLLFYTHHQSESSPDTLVGRHGEKQRSKPLIPEMCFNTVSKAANESGEGHLSTPHLERDGTSRLLSCTQCCVRVHASCYGVSADEAEQDWLCARCEANAKTEDCCLCSLRGGALHRANNDKWVHVLCAITVLEARFVDIAERSPIDLRGIPLPRFRLKCQFCRKRMRQEVNGCCVQCSHGRCSTSFHPTCAQAAGVLMYPDDWPFVVFITCHRHKAMGLLEKRIKIGMAELTVGQKVISKFKNGRYYHSEVVELTSATFYEVIFDDGSYSDNLFPEDIENRDCVRLGPPSEGDMVQVRWTDGLIYGAKFVKSQSIPMYQVEFEDGSQISVKREEIYSLEEDLPKRVKSRMSVASDQKFGIFTEKDVKKNSKRQRVINSRYREDYVEPIIYRAILD